MKAEESIKIYKMLKLYNTLSGKKEFFKPLKGKKVTIYTCGPTVYDYAHIGNMRAYVTADILRKYLEHLNYRVYQIKNITDVGHMVADQDEGEDKIIKKALEEKQTPYQVAEFYEIAFKEDEYQLNIKAANVYPKATNHIKEMISIIQKLIKRGYAYEKNGSVYFSVEKFSRYGQLSGNTLDKLSAGARIACHPDKKNAHDFALWKKAETNRLMKWDSPWGKGFPGWHIECSAMSTKYLGDTVDIHTGGEDNIFPHHEDEIAQTEAATDKKFVRFWFHVRHLLVNGKKMSKSLKNFYTIKDIEKLGYNSIALRYLYLTSHYRDPLNFTLKSLEAAENTLSNINDLFFILEKAKFTSKNKNQKINQKIKETDIKFKKYLDDDLNTPQAIASVFELINLAKNSIKRGDFSSSDQKNLKKALKRYDSVLGFLLKAGENIEIDEDVKMLIDEREKARKEKDWAHADALRDQIEEDGFIIDDTPWGTHVKRKPKGLEK